MTRIVVIGSGPTGSHFALTALRKGKRVLMLDVGNERPEIPLPEVPVEDLTDTLDDPVEYFLGEGASHTSYPREGALYYEFPASKAYVFAQPNLFHADSVNLKVLSSFARGGLAEAWTAGVYTFNDAELADFPVGFADLEPHYREVARRIGINGADDDLSQFTRYDPEYLEPLRLDAHSEDLLRVYRSRRKWLNQRLGFHMGLSRLATLTRGMGQRRGCSHLGRCFWGCPRESIYVPSFTLRDCRRYPQFEYLPGHYVTHLEFNPQRRVHHACSIRLEDDRIERTEGDVFVLAAGTLCSSKIFLDSWYQATGELRRLPGLMDVQTVVIPFLNLRRAGTPPDLASYQFHQLAIGIRSQRPEEYVHGQITALKAAPIHPIVQALPTSLPRAARMFRAVRAGLGVVNVWCHDRRRDANFVTIRPLGDSSETELVLRYQTGPDLDAALAARRVVRRALRKLGCVAPKGMTQILPKGDGVQYAGTLPMLRRPLGFSTHPDGRCNGFPNLYVVDGATFPFLPAKNMTLTLMANAVRIADCLS